jgi:hypothetical protein
MPDTTQSDGAALYADNCAACHGADGSGGTSGEDVRGESASEIREAIVEEAEMNFLDFLTYDEIQKIALYMATVDDDENDDDEEGDEHPDHDGDGICDDDEGYGGPDSDDEDSDDDGTPDYMDPKTTHFPSDNHAGNQILITSHGQFVACSTVDESSSLPDAGKPENVDFPWGFVDFTVKGLTPHGSVEITLIAPADLPEGTRYWKYEGDEYYALDGAVIDGRKITFTLTDEDGDGIVVDPGAAGTPSVTSLSGGGGGGCTVAQSANSTSGIALGGFIILLIPLFLRWEGLRKRA